MSIVCEEKKSTQDIINNFKSIISSETDIMEYLLNTPDLCVVSLGCGDYPIEYVAIKEIVNRQFKFFGFDISEKRIHSCKQKFGNDENCHFIAIDASNVIEVQRCLGDQKASLVVLRHPLLNNTNPEIDASFRKMYTKVIHAIIKPGSFIITSNYYHDEAEETKKLLTAITLCPIKTKGGCGIYSGDENSFAIAGYGMRVPQKVKLPAEQHFSTAKYEPTLCVLAKNSCAATSLDNINFLVNGIEALLATWKGKKQFNRFLNHHAIVVSLFFESLIEKITKEEKPCEFLQTICGSNILQEISIKLEQKQEQILQHLEYKMDEPYRILLSYYLLYGRDTYGENPLLPSADLFRKDQKAILTAVIEEIIITTNHPSFQRMDAQGRAVELTKALQHASLTPPEEKKKTAVIYIHIIGDDRITIKFCFNYLS